MSQATKVVIDLPEKAADPTISLDMLSKIFVSVGWLAIAGGLIAAIAMASQEQPIAGITMGGMIVLGGGSWLLFWLCRSSSLSNRGLCRNACEKS